MRLIIAEKHSVGQAIAQAVGGHAEKHDGYIQVGGDLVTWAQGHLVDLAVLANLTVDMVKKYESEKYRIQPSDRMKNMLEHYLAEHRRAVVAIVERHRGEERATLSFSRVSNLPDDLPDWIKAEASAKRRAAAVREAAVLLEAEGVAVDYTYLPEETD